MTPRRSTISCSNGCGYFADSQGKPWAAYDAERLASLALALGWHIVYPRRGRQFYCPSCVAQGGVPEAEGAQQEAIEELARLRDAGDQVEKYLTGRASFRTNVNRRTKIKRGARD